MNNNGLIKYKEGFISKIKKLFKKILEKSEKQYNYMQQESINNLKKDNYLQNSIINDLKVNVKSTNKVAEINNFLQRIEGNEEALKMLSIDRLKKLEKYYNNIIEQNNEKINKLKKTT
ncbi:MAG: hypothetical protein E7313_07795 [Clostridiales bacterium]|nr:hypothetical protein [Clostridiales bacterium]